MIDQKINDSLKSLEQELRNIESARKQVEKTVDAYNGLNSSTTQYVQNLSSLTTKVKDLVAAVENDYSSKMSSFEKDRKSIIDSANAASNKLAEATDSFRKSLGNVENKLKYCLILNVIMILALIALSFIKH